MCLCVCLSLCVFAGNKPELNCPSTVPVVSDWTCCEAEKVSHAQSPEHECNREYDPREMDGAPFRQLHKLFFELRFLSDRHTDTQTHRHTDTQTQAQTQKPTALCLPALQSAPVDIEEAATLADRMGACAYYASRTAVEFAEVSKGAWC